MKSDDTMAVHALSGVATNTIGDACGAGDLKPLIHKVLHGVVGGAASGILGGSQGPLSGAMSAVIAETLADLVMPQAEEIRNTLFQSGCDDPLTAYNDYLTTQKNLLVLTTASIMAGLGQDVDVAIQTADNALTHNAVQLARDTVIDFVADKTGFDKSTVSKTFDGLILTSGLIQPAKGGVKAVGSYAVKKGVKTVKPYEVGTFQDLKNRSTPGDGIEMHHAVHEGVENHRPYTFVCKDFAAAPEHSINVS